MADYDKLTIKIVANTGVAIDSIDRLSSRLNKLEEQSKQMDFSRLRELQKILQDISNLDFNKASAGLWSLAESFNKVSKLGSNLELAPKLEPLDDNSYTNVGKDIKKGLDEITVAAKDTTESVISQWDEVEQKGLDVADAISTIEDETETIASSIPVSFGVLRKNLMSTTDMVDELTNTFSRGSASVNKDITKVAIKLKSLALYRVLRLILMKIQQEFSKSIQQLAQFDPAFNQSISELSSSFQYLTTSIVSSIAPILETLTPLITDLSDGLSMLISQFGALMGGTVQAKKQANDYAESLKNIKKNALGIDELNIIQKDQEESPFENVEVDNSLSSAIDKVAGGLESIAASIGLIVLGYTAFKGGDLVANLTSIGGAILIISGALTSITSVIDILKNGVEWSNIIPFITGVTLAIAGLGLKFGALGVTIGGIIAAVSVLAIGIKELIKGWSDMGTWQKIIGAMTMLMGLATGIGTVIALITHDFALAAILGGFAAASVAGTIALSKQAQNGISFATGGFPEDGFFFANHNELVGKFDNGKTAVANNEQITQGIHDAVLSALQEGGNLAGGNIVLQLDGREIARTTQKYNDLNENKVFSGGKKYGW